MDQEVPDGLLELVLPQLMRSRHTERLRKSLDLGCVPVAVVELAQRDLLRELAHGSPQTTRGAVATDICRFTRSNAWLGGEIGSIRPNVDLAPPTLLDYPCRGIKRIGMPWLPHKEKHNVRGRKCEYCRSWKFFTKTRAQERHEALTQDSRELLINQQ